MKRILVSAAVASMMMSGAALAQNTTPRATDERAGPGGPAQPTTSPMQNSTGTVGSAPMRDNSPNRPGTSSQTGPQTGAPSENSPSVTGPTGTKGGAAGGGG